MIKAYLISSTKLHDGAQQFLASRSLTWAHDANALDSELIAELAGRVCYMSFGSLQFRKSTQEYLRNILKQGHESVLEHANFGLLLDEISRALSHQIVRHRAGFAYSQLSQQYHDESDADFLPPATVQDDPELMLKWQKWREMTLALYGDIRESERAQGAAAHMQNRESIRASRSAARSVLPNASRTTMVITGNARAWLNLLRTRGHIEGDVEMRQYCVAVWSILSEVAPTVFEEFELCEDAVGQYVGSKVA